MDDTPRSAGHTGAVAINAIGQALRRKEDLRLVTGQGKFSDDFVADGQAVAALVRSPHAHARIVAIDSDAARGMPGVIGVFTGRDCQASGLGDIPHSPVPQTRFDLKLTGPQGKPVFIGPHRLLPIDTVRHVGEAVALVVAKTRAQAQLASEAVHVTYEQLPVVTDIAAALAERAPTIWPEVPDNVLVETSFGDAAATEQAFAAADHIVRFEFHIPRVTATPTELRSALAIYDTATDRYTLYAGSGGAVRQKAELAAVLGIQPAQLRVICPDVGGNFGSRNRVYVEFGLALWAARQLGCPVKYTATRSEAFLTDYQGRDLLTHIELALRKDGRFLAIRASNVSNVGAYCVSLSPLGKGAALITGSYDIPAAALRARAVFTNTMPTNAYRSSGRPEVTFAIEQLIDKAAAELGFDRIALRRKNLIKPNAMPYANPVGATYDSGTYRTNMDLAMQIADWDGVQKRRRAAKARGKLFGLGLANYVESSIGAPRERAEMTVSPEGFAEVVVGTQPSGQGHETSFAQVASDLTGIPVDAVRIVVGDTDIVSVGGGSHSGRSMRHAATVMTKAATALIGRGKEIAARMLNSKPDLVTFVDGRFALPGSNRSYDFLELAREATSLGVPKIAAAADNEMHEPVFPNGCAVCEVEIDPDTGELALTRYAAVDDVGRCINPLIVHGQTHGGIAQGVGEALGELCALDENGQVLSGSFMDYWVPRAHDLPSFRTEIVEVLSPTNPLGIKAGGEGGTTPALAVVFSAILDALRPYGVRALPMPATPFVIWQAIQHAKAQGKP